MERPYPLSQELPPPAPKANCNHEQVHFSSGDYYIFCDACGRKWALMGPGKEYNSDDTNWIGAYPQWANQGFSDATNPFRYRKS